MASAGGPEDAPTTGTQGRQRRTSFAEMFSNRRPSMDQAKPSRSSLSTAMQQAQEQSKTRRLSITSQLGLSGSAPSNGQPSPFNPIGKARNGSEASQSREDAIQDEQAVEDADPVPRSMNGDRGSPTFGRRISQGAKAYSELRSSFSTANGGNSPPRGNGNTGAAPGSPSAKKDGFNWSENLRNRAERSSVSAAASGTSPTTTGFFGSHRRNTSAGFGEPAAASAAVANTPPKPVQKAPDHFQERILKGDFYMD